MTSNYYWIMLSPLLYYFIYSFSIYLVFRVINKKSYLSFIPIINTYSLYKCYQNRVYKRNWGILIIIWVFLLLMFTLFIFVYSFSDPLGVSVKLSNKNLIYLGMISIFIGGIFDLILIYPLLYNNNLKKIITSIIFAINFYVIYKVYIYSQNVSIIYSIDISRNISSIKSAYDVSIIFVMLICSILFYKKKKIKITK